MKLKKCGGIGRALTCLSAGLAFGLAFAGCRTEPRPPVPPSSPPPGPAAPQRPAPSAPKADRTQTAEFFRQVDALSPRPSGSPKLDQLRAFLRRQLSEFGLKVEEEPFSAFTRRGPTAMANLWAEKPGAKDQIVYIASHIDTKDIPGQNFRGANDSGSSTAALLEIARVAAGMRTKATLRFLFLDGEESFGPSITASDGLYGSRQHAGRLAAAGRVGAIKAFILLDMIGDQDLALTRDLNSSAALVDRFASCARDTGNEDILRGWESAIIDDHIPFVQLGIPALDLIDFDYGPGNAYWHTAEDTADKVSTESMARVVDCVLCLIARLDADADSAGH